MATVEISSNLELEIICRICLKTGELIPLTEKQLFDETFAEMLSFCSTMQVNEDNNYPKQICTKCIEQLGKTYLFLKTYENANLILQNYIKDNCNRINKSFELLNLNKEISKEPHSNEKVNSYNPEELNNIESINLSENIDNFVDNTIDTNDIELSLKYLLEYSNSTNSLDDNYYSESFSTDLIDYSFLKYLSEIDENTLDENLDFQNSIPFDNKQKVSQDKNRNNLNVTHNSIEEIQNVTESNKEELSKNFESKLRLTDFKAKNEMQKNEKRKYFKCKKCKKGFYIYEKLQFHERVHDGKPEFYCEVCNKEYTRMEYLRAHMNSVHLGKKPFKCNICDKSFSLMHVLKQHELIHKGLKIHKCNICQRAFIRDCVLRRHKETHFKINCYICNKSFSGVKALENHIQKYH